MSVRVMTLVWDRFPRGGSEMLVMLAMADWCNDRGLSLHPSNDAVSRKCRISVSQVQRVIRALVTEGWLQVIGNVFGGPPGATKQYRLCLEKLSSLEPFTGSADATRQDTDTGSADAIRPDTDTGSTHATGSIDATGSMGAARRVAPMRPTGSTHATQTTIEPNTEPSDTLSGSSRSPDHVPPRHQVKTSSVLEVITYLNRQARRSYQLRTPDGKTLTKGAKLIADRLRQGYTVEQCKDVIGEKSNQWMGDPKMDQFLRPSTLFTVSNFEQYLAEAQAEEAHP